MARPLITADALHAREALAASLHGDPLFRWLLPQPARRRAWLRVLAASALEDSLSECGARVPDEGPRAGCIAVLPPGTYPPPALRGWEFWIRGRRRPALPRPTVRLAIDGFRAQRSMERHHPRRPHYYVAAVGVHPRCAGRGLGTELVGSALAEADLARAPVYLETASPASIGFYLRFGFRVVRKLEPVAKGPPIWTLLREPPS